MTALFIDTHAQSVQQAVQAFTETHGLPRNLTLEQNLSATLVAVCKGLDLSAAQFRHIATLILNDEKRIQSGAATAERKGQLAMQAIADLKGQLRVNSTARVLQFIHALNAHLKAERPELHAALKANDARGGALGSEPHIVRHLARDYRARLDAKDRAGRQAKWPAKHAADAVSDGIHPGGLLSGHVPPNSIVGRQREIERQAEATPASFDDAG